MSRELKEKLLVTLILVAWYIWMPQVGFTAGMEGRAHITYLLCHANIWHLAGNVFVLWMMRGKLHLLPAILVAILSTFLPVFGSVWDGLLFDGQTMGFSGVLFAIAGVQWGRLEWSKNTEHDRFIVRWSFFSKAVPWAFVFVLIPHINWSLHLYCMILGYIYGRCRR